MIRDRGTLLVLVGVGLLVVTLAASALLAPPREAEIDGDRTAETLVGVQGAGVGFRDSGNVHLLNGSERVWERTDAESYFEVEGLSDGSVATAFIADGYTACGEYDPPCPRTGYRIVAPGPDGRVASEFTVPVRRKTNSEVHAVEVLPDGGVAFTDMERERLVVVEDGSVAWEWTAEAFYDAPPDPASTDWLHINDVDYLGDDRFLVSVRNANQILVIERGAGVVEVVNEDRGEATEETCRQSHRLQDYDDDGEVRCGDPAVLNQQHNPHWLGDGAILVADSENDRVVELHRTDEGRWEPVWTLERAGGLAFDWPRDADRLPDGNTLVSDTFNKRVLEVNETGTVVWSVSLRDNPYEADRLPAGEQVGVPTYGDGESLPGDGGRGAAADRNVPVLSTVVVALHSAVPGLPFWVGERHVLVALVSLGLVAVGLFVRLRR